MKKNTLVCPFLLMMISALLSCGHPKDLQYLDFQNLRLQKAGISESVVTADIRYFNPNNFKLQLKEADLDLFVNEKYVGHSHLDTLIHIPAKDTFYVPVSVKLNLADLFKNALQLVLNPEVSLKIEGKAKVGKAGIYKNFPVSYQGKERIDVLLKDTSTSNLLK
jgi:LEA14-like dessication related protein